MSTESYRHTLGGDKLGLAPIRQQLPQLAAASRAPQRSMHNGWHLLAFKRTAIFSAASSKAAHKASLMASKCKIVAETCVEEVFCVTWVGQGPGHRRSDAVCLLQGHNVNAQRTWQ
jgi:hypothetical protein